MGIESSHAEDWFEDVITGPDALTNGIYSLNSAGYFNPQFFSTQNSTEKVPLSTHRSGSIYNILKLKFSVEETYSNSWIESLINVLLRQYLGYKPSAVVSYVNPIDTKPWPLLK